MPSGVSKPLNMEGEQTGGPQQSVNATDSTDYQPKGVWEGRAAHGTAKATDSIPGRNECWTSPLKIPRCRTFRNNAIVFSQPKHSSMRFRFLCLMAYPNNDNVRAECWNHTLWGVVLRAPRVGPSAPIAVRCRFGGETVSREMKTRPPRPCQSSPAPQVPVQLRWPSVRTA